MNDVNVERFLRRAIELSRLGMEAGDGGPFGAVVVRDGQIVGEGWNRVVRDIDPTSHAEVVAIRDACRRLGQFRLTGCQIFTSAEPCPMCLAAIYWGRLDRIVFASSATDAALIGFDDAFFYEQLGLPAERRQVPQVQALREEALVVFRDYAAKADRVPY